MLKHIETKCCLFHSSSKRRFIPMKLLIVLINRIVAKREKFSKLLGVCINENLIQKNAMEKITCIIIFYIETICVISSKSYFIWTKPLSEIMKVLSLYPVFESYILCTNVKSNYFLKFFMNYLP